MTPEAIELFDFIIELLTGPNAQFFNRDFLWDKYEILFEETNTEINRIKSENDYPHNIIREGIDKLWYGSQCRDLFQKLLGSLFDLIDPTGTYNYGTRMGFYSLYGEHFKMFIKKYFLCDILSHLEHRVVFKFVGKLICAKCGGEGVICQIGDKVIGNHNEYQRVHINVSLYRFFDYDCGAWKLNEIMDLHS